MRRTKFKHIVGYLITLSLIFLLYWISGSDDRFNDEKEIDNDSTGVQHELVNCGGHQAEIPKLTQSVLPDEIREINSTPFPVEFQEVAQGLVTTVIPLMSPEPIDTSIPETVSGVTSFIERDDIVECNGIEIKYSNTIYRMDEEVLDKITTLISNEPYVSSFILYDINTEAVICYNENKYYPAASTVKAPFVLSCLQQIDNESHTLDDDVQYKEENKWSGDGVIQYREYGTMFTIEELIEYTIKFSDDTGYMMLLEFFREKNYNDFLVKLGNRVTIGGSVRWGNTSAMDSLRNWKEIYRYIETSSENANFFSGLLEKTNKSYIRNALGNKYTILNKMGWGVNNPCCHDHAIVMAEQPYMLMIMTMGDSGEMNQRFIEQLSIYLDEVHERMVGGRSL